jgi:hypothetical protein
MRRTWIVFALLAGLVLGIVGCGGPAVQTPSATQPPQKENPKMKNEAF